MADSNTPRPSVGIIGAGAAGSHIALALSELGFPVVAIASRTRRSAATLAAMLPDAEVTEIQTVADKCDLVFVTVPDDAIARVVAEVRWRSGQRVVQCSGVTPLHALSDAKAAGAFTGGFHPLQTLTGAPNPERLRGITFGIEAEEPLYGELTGIAAALGSRWLRIGEDDRPLYHAAGVLASNYVVTLMDLAVDLWAELGADRQDALKALLPLLRGTIDNLETVGLPHALTGPVARGDTGTVRAHISSLADRSPEALEAYRALAERTIEVAIEKGSIGRPRAEALRDIVTTYHPETARRKVGQHAGR